MSGWKTLGVFASTTLALGAMSALANRRTSTMSKVETDDDDDDDRDEGDPQDPYVRLDMYAQHAMNMIRNVPEQSEDVDTIIDESYLDLLHEGVKSAIRMKNPLMMFRMTYDEPRSHGQDTYEGLTGSDPEKWHDPNVRFLVFYSAALQGRSMHDKIKRVKPSPSIFMTPTDKDDDDAFFFHPHAGTHEAMARAMQYAAGGANIALEAGATSPNKHQVEVIDRTLDRSNALMERYAEMVKSVERREATLDRERRELRKKAKAEAKLVSPKKIKRT